MPIANAQALRLREAIDDYLRSVAGDTGSRRQGGVNRRVNDADRELYELAQTLHSKLDSSDNAPASKRDTPGARARDRAMQEPNGAISRGDDGFPVLRGGRAVTNEPAGTPAGGRQEVGAQ
jgi:Ni,Fe-hydrogenase III large subunit